MPYDYRRYNQYDVLKPHWGFWLTILFLSRHIAGFLLIAISGRTGGKGGGVSQDAIDLGAVISLIEPIYMIADIPALALFYALGARLPKSGAAVRWVWGAGRHLLLAAIVIYLTLFALTRGLDIAAYGATTWINMGLNALVVAYILRSRYLRDLFGTFPPPTDAEPS